METYLHILENALEFPEVIALLQLLLGLAALILVVIFFAHTVSLLGRKTFLYRKKHPIDGWSKRFYPAICVLLLFVGCLYVWTLM